MGGMMASMSENPNLWLQGVGAAANIAGMPNVGNAASLAGNIADYSTVGKAQDAYTTAKVKQDNKQPLTPEEQKVLATGAPKRTPADVTANVVGSSNRLAASREAARKDNMQQAQVRAPQAMPIQQGRGGAVIRAQGATPTLSSQAQLLTRLGLQNRFNPDDYFRGQQVG